MATALRHVENATFVTFTVEAAQAVTQWHAVELAAAGVRDAQVNSDTIIGIARHSAAAGERVEVTMLGPIESCVVAAAGVTIGLKVQAAATGLVEDAAAHDSSGATDDSILGMAMQTGTSGQIVGVMLMASNRGSA